MPCDPQNHAHRRSSRTPVHRPVRGMIRVDVSESDTLRAVSALPSTALNGISNEVPSRSRGCAVPARLRDLRPCRFLLVRLLPTSDEFVLCLKDQLAEHPDLSERPLCIIERGCESRRLCRRETSNPCADRIDDPVGQLGVVAYAHSPKLAHGGRARPSTRRQRISSVTTASRMTPSTRSSRIKRSPSEPPPLG